MMDFPNVDAWDILEGAVKKVTDAAGNVLWELIRWILGPEVYKTEESGCTADITGASSYTFDEETGAITLGSKSSHTLASLHSSKTPVYTGVKNNVMTLKRVTARKETTTPAYYSEGTPSVEEAWYAEGSVLSGKASGTLNKTTGQYTVSGTASDTVENLFRDKGKIYISGGTSLKWYQVTDRSIYTYYDYVAEPLSWGDWTTETGGGVTIEGHWTYEFDAVRGIYTTSEYDLTHYTLYEGDIAGELTGQILYTVSADGKTLYAHQGRCGATYCEERRGASSVTTNTVTSIDYEVTTCTQGTTYTPASTAVSYTVETKTQTASEN